MDCDRARRDRATGVLRLPARWQRGASAAVGVAAQSRPCTGAPMPAGGRYPVGGGAGAHGACPMAGGGARGAWPRVKVSTITMGVPQQGHRRACSVKRSCATASPVVTGTARSGDSGPPAARAPAPASRRGWHWPAGRSGGCDGSRLCAAVHKWLYAEYRIMQRMLLAGGSNLRDINRLCRKNR